MYRRTYGSTLIIEKHSFKKVCLEHRMPRGVSRQTICDKDAPATEGGGVTPLPPSPQGVEEP